MQGKDETFELAGMEAAEMLMNGQSEWCGSSRVCSINELNVSKNSSIGRLSIVRRRAFKIQLKCHCNTCTSRLILHSNAFDTCQSGSHRPPQRVSLVSSRLFRIMLKLCTCIVFAYFRAAISIHYTHASEAIDSIFIFYASAMSCAATWNCSTRTRTWRDLLIIMHQRTNASRMQPSHTFAVLASDFAAGEKKAPIGFKLNGFFHL